MAPLTRIRSVFALAVTLAASGALHAQEQPGSWLQANRASLGLSAARAEVAIGCGSSLLPCRDRFAAAEASQLQDTLRWSMEANVLRPGSPGMGIASGRQGLALSLVGRRPVALFGSRFSLYGKLGATSSQVDPSLATMPVTALDSGHGLAFGAGVSMDFTPRLSASFGVDSYDLRLSGQRDPVRATSLGLQYRY